MRRAIAAALLVLAGAGVLSIVTPGAAAQQAKAKPASTAVPSSAADLDLLLGPVALYPDTLLAQILLCANNPTQVTRLAQWLPVNKLTGTELQDAATVDGFDPEFVALSLFPTVVNYMSQNLDWTTKLGKAFTANKTAVFDSIQRLRAKAQKAGALKDSTQQNVETKTTSSGQEVIVIEPANPQVIYVPQYNPTVVYAAPPTQTVVVEDNSADAAVAGLIGFTAGIAIGAAIDNDNYYGPYGWHGGAYMYNDAWNDYYDAREDAREDWMDHREDLYEERGERRENTQEQRTDRAENRQENRPESSAQRQQAAQQAQANRQAAGTQSRTATQSTTRSTTAGSGEARGYSSGGATAASRSGTKSDAFSGYSSGKAERAASSRGPQSRSSSRGGGGGGGRRR